MNPSDEPATENFPDYLVPEPNTAIIGASFSIPKVLIAVFQLVYAVVTLYRSRGDQIARYGYAAFSLSVVPYAVMSLFNLIGALVTPDYLALNLVASDVMGEAIRRGAQFDGVVGRLIPDSEPSAPTITVLLRIGTEGVDCLEKFSYSDGEEAKSLLVAVTDYSPDPATDKSNALDLSPSIFVPTCSKFRRLNNYQYELDINQTSMTDQRIFRFRDCKQPKGISSTNIACLVYGGVVIAIIGALSRFTIGSSTYRPRVWLMVWYCFGIYFGTIRMDRVYAPSSTGMLLNCFLFSIPAIGGFVVVAQMLLASGTCTLGP
jgi:hypothetical protein